MLFCRSVGIRLIILTLSGISVGLLCLSLVSINQPANSCVLSEYLQEKPPKIVIKNICSCPNAGSNSTGNTVEPLTKNSKPDYNAKLRNLMLDVSTKLLRAQSKVHNGEALEHILSSLDSVQNVLHELGLQDRTNVKDSPTPNPKQAKERLDVCPEEYKGSTFGYPFFYHGFEMTKCANVKPLNEVVSVLLNFVGHPADYWDRIEPILSGIARNYSTLSVHIASHKTLPKTIMKKYNLDIHVYDSFKSDTFPGVAWNYLIASTKTPYALVARDITHFTDDVRLERLIRESNDLHIPYVGSALRTPDGHWSMACQQVVYRNFTTVYRAGYHMSQHSCVYCDHLTGPFLAKTHFLKSVKFSEDLSNAVLFEDYFLKVKLKKLPTIVCPDSMFFILSERKDIRIQKTWVPLAAKWELNRLRLANNDLFTFSCQESKTRCEKQKGLGLSPCCLQYLSDLIKTTMKICEDANLYCELQEGTALGAVKFNKVLPWERDSDIAFHTANYTALKQLAASFTKAGLSISSNAGPWCCADDRPAGGKFLITAPSWHAELYGQHIMDSELLTLQGLKPTKVFFDGMWVSMPRNPGLFVRNRYGYDIYKHELHWMDLGRGSGWDLYKPSKFAPCPKPGHHSCLDQYVADGNLHFEEPSV